MSEKELRPVTSIRLSPAGLAVVDEIAAAEGVGRSEMIRRLLVEAVAARAKKGQGS